MTAPTPPALASACTRRCLRSLLFAFLAVAYPTACASGTPAPDAAPSSQASTPGPTSAASSSANPSVSPFGGLMISGPTWPQLFSQDGRYIALDAVVDLETKRRVPFDCDLGFASWNGPSIVCVDRTHTHISLLNMVTAESKSFPYGGEGVPELLDSTGDTLALVRPDGRSTTVTDIQSGATQTVPGRPLGPPFGVHVRVTQFSNTENAGDPEIVRLWDLSQRVAIGDPYRIRNFLTAVPSPDGRWVFGSNTAEGSFLVDASTGTRRIVARPEEDSVYPLGTLAPFSPDSSLVAIAERPKGTKLVNTATGAISARLVAPGCGTPINFSWSSTGDVVVVGSDSARVCAFEVAGGKLLWSTDLGARPEVPSGGDAYAVHSKVTVLEFTADGKGLLAGLDASMGLCYSVLLRASTGEVVKALGPTQCLSRDADGDIISSGFLIGPDLRVGPRSESAPHFNCDPDTCVAFQYCVKGPAPGRDKWKDAEPLAVDPKGHRVAGVVDGHIHVWDAITGESLYEQ